MRGMRSPVGGMFARARAVSAEARRRGCDVDEAAGLLDPAGGSIGEPQLETAFDRRLPVQPGACHARLSRFFRQWFDTPYSPGGGTHRPVLTGPGLAGPGFGGRCR